MPVTGWVKAQSVTGTNWSALVGGDTLLDGVLSPNDGRLNLHADPTNDYLECLDYDFTSEGLISTDVIDGIEFECYGTTGMAQVTTGNTMGVYLTLDGSTPASAEKEFNCDGPGMQDDILGASNDPWGLALTGADVLTATFGVLIREGSNSSGSPNWGRRVDYERMRIHYSAGTVTPSVLLSSKTRRIPDIGAIRNKGLGEKVQ